ncbi:MAG: GMC family oxidoreductase N-terminal domain-containing protein, partial [Sphingomicrobium sp.]
MIITELSPTDRQYPVVVIGTGFGSLFFVHRLLQLRPDIKILMLEQGPLRSWEQQVEEGRNSGISSDDTFVRTGKRKRWHFTIGYGGGTNCWSGNTPRMHPNDFRLKTRYGRGQDWPISYDELEPYYAIAEEIMEISGPDDLHVIGFRSRPYPQPPHRLTSACRLMKQAQPDMHFAMPSARARVATKQRPRCCASFHCSLCPVGAKFTAFNGFSHVTEHPNVRILPEAEVLELERSTSNVSGVRFRQAGREQRVGCDLCILGANTIHSPAILLRSGFDHPLLGRGLNEQLGYGAEVLLDGLDSLDGSSLTSGINYSLYDGAFRSEHGAAMIKLNNNFPQGLRPEFGRWRQMVYLSVATEQELLDENRVTIDRGGNVVVHFERQSPYAEQAVKWSREQLPKILAPLPVEQIRFKQVRITEGHVQGTMRMGSSSADS